MPHRRTQEPHFPAAAMAATALSYVKESLGKPADGQEPASIQLQLECIARLRTIACAMGEAAAEKELLPFLESLGKETEQVRTGGPGGLAAVARAHPSRPLGTCPRRAPQDPPRRMVDEVLTSLAEVNCSPKPARPNPQSAPAQLSS